ncbi:MAG TPA: hypothetical protein VK249_04195 [Anaerolineales bacterium]|nr:hypothetical protein [Anaerolineales bacterium]
MRQSPFPDALALETKSFVQDIDPSPACRSFINRCRKIRQELPARPTKSNFYIANKFSRKI